MEMSRGMIGKIHQDYYPIEETNLWHTIYFNKTAILSGFTFRAVYNIYDAKLHNFFHISIKIIRKIFNILTINNYTHHSALFRVQN